jgi:uroporphyrinogen decarboxylase
MTMTSRERVLKALHHEEPDRVPLDLGATRNSGILAPTYRALTEFLALDDANEPELHGHAKLLGLTPPSEAVLQRLAIDFRGITLGKADHSKEALLPDGTYRDELGVIRRQPTGMPYWELTVSPFAGEVTVHDVINWDWPDPTDPGHIRGLREKALAVREQTEYALVLHLQDIIVHPTQFLLGFEKWYLSFYLDPALINTLMDIMLELRTEVTRRALAEVGDLIDVVSCSDDVGDARGSILSPEMYGQFIKPRHRRYFETVRSLTPATILYHSCGAVADLIPSFIDMGIDFINPVQVSAAGMDPQRLKEEYGDKIGFWGGIDTTRVLPFGTPETVIEEVKARLRDLAGNGGYVLAAVHNLQPDVPAENIVAMYDAAREYGRYPIS